MIIDTHVHFYDTERPEGLPWPESTNEILYRPSMPSRYKPLALPAGITGVIVEEASTWVEDNQWILDLAADEPLVKGFVGNLDPEDEAFEEHVNRFSANPIFRGIRVRTGRVFPYGSARIRDCLNLLAERNLSLDLIAGAATLEDLARLARDHSSLRIIINHTAGIAVDGNAPDPAWSAGMEAVSDFENVYCKLSGMVEKAGSEFAPTDVEFYRPTIDVLVRTLGVDRLVYSSNWTPCERVGPYELTLNIVREYFASMGDEVLEKILWKNSKAAYRWISRE
jgi:L-fuconolactonase